MAEEPTLPSLPKVSWDSHTQTFTNTRKRNRDGALAQPIFSNSSDPAVFSSDDDPHVDNYVNGRHRKKRYVGSWFQQMPTSSDSTFAEAVELQPKPKRTFERQWDSGVWMGSDGSVEPDEEFAMGIEQPPESKLPQLRNPCPTPSVAPEDVAVFREIDKAIEEGNPDVNLSSLALTTISDGPISRLAELTLIPSVDKDVPFEQASPELGLYLSNNRLTRAPGALFNLEHLTYLSLRNNQISELPPTIGKLRNLRELNISLNRLRYLPGELLSLLKFPSALSSLHIHPNPFHRPETRLPPRPELGDVASDEERLDDLISSGYLPLFEGKDTAFISPDNRSVEEIRQELSTAAALISWQVVLLARSPVQYSDSRGSILSSFCLPRETPGGNAQSREFGENQHATVQTEDVSVLSILDAQGRATSTPSKPSQVLSLFELALKSASRAAQTWDLSSYLSPDAPLSVLQSIDRIKVQSTLNGNLGTLPCSTCGRHVTTPLAQWIEWWDISKEGHTALEPLSMDPNENADIRPRPLVEVIISSLSLRCRAKQRPMTYIMSTTTYQSPYKPTPTSTQLDTFVRWLRLRKYRMEVTYGVYVYTPMEKIVFWTLFCFFFTILSMALVLYTHRALMLSLRAAASYIDSHGLSGSLVSHLLTAKHAATGLTASAKTRGAIELMSGTAKNSQVA
ncbi:hypothetical protein NUW58_g6546 [Xylaria curta]|uniref:Uncharacterized protein n=1 Tax=Xylaria curta TaxID=42375 RepID=A0ACC1NRN8_9PEZI|nr:hypothetical protein NUW58_g6546 [Xylaria curta]